MENPAESPDLTVSAHWFFIGEAGDQYKASMGRTDRRVVHPGECFGFRASFLPVRGDVDVKVLLRVPSNPERFPYSSGGVVTISDDRQSVLVNEKESGLKGAAASYWGIDGGDPKGDHELVFWLNGKQIDTYKFTVD